MEIINAHQLRVASQEAPWFKWPWASSAPFQSTTLKKYICLPSNLKLGRELFSIPASSQLVRVVCSDCFPGETWTMPLGEIMKYSFPFSYHRQQVASSHKSRARILASHDTTGFNHLKSTCVPRKHVFNTWKHHLKTNMKHQLLVPPVLLVHHNQIVGPKLTFFFMCRHTVDHLHSCRFQRFRFDPSRSNAAISPPAGLIDLRALRRKQWHPARSLRSQVQNGTIWYNNL